MCAAKHKSVNVVILELFKVLCGHQIRYLAVKPAFLHQRDEEEWMAWIETYRRSSLSLRRCMYDAIHRTQAVWEVQPGGRPTPQHNEADAGIGSGYGGGGGDGGAQGPKQKGNGKGSDGGGGGGGQGLFGDKPKNGTDL